MRSIVLITVDCLRSDHVGCYGYDRATTPNIDNLAATGTKYKYSYANCPGTRWALQSLHTGVPTIRIDGIGIPEDYTSLPEHLQQAGYVTGGFVNNGFASREYRYHDGYDTFYSVSDINPNIKKIGKKINNVLDSDLLYEYILKPANNTLTNWGTATQNESSLEPGGEHTDTDTVDKALNFIDENDGRAYFLWVHLMDAHTPYYYWPNHLRELRGDANIQHVQKPHDEIIPGEPAPKKVIDTYDAGIRSADEQIGRLLSAISDDATVIVTGDHGEEFGEYGYFHWTSFYSSITQVPIVVKDENIPSGESEIPAQHLDIPATILFSADIEIPEHWKGQPLQISERSVDDPIFFSFDSDRIAVRVNEWKYIRETHGEDETGVPDEYSRDGSKLFRVAHGESEDEPVNNPGIRKTLDQLLDEYVSSSVSVGEARIELEQDEELADEVSSNLEDLGYL